jgi:hypothetical protein
MVTAAVRKRVEELYPALSFLLRDREVGKLLIRATDPNKGYSPARFQAELYKTRWWRKRSESQRQWAILKATDPAEARHRANLHSASLIKDAESLGINLTSKQVKTYTESMLAQGIEPGSDRAMANLMAFAKARPGQMGAGAFKTASMAVQELERSQYFRQTPRGEAERWATWIVLGRKTLEDFQAAAQHSAMHRFPHMEEQLRAGRTVADIVAPFVEAYAREMDWDPAGVMAKMHSNPKFAGLTGIRDPKTGQMRLPTEYEAATMARQRNDWWQTTSGRQQDAAMTQTLLQAFGRRA